MSNKENPSTAQSTIFSNYEVDRIEDIQRVLVRIADPSIAVIAYRLGYDEQQHAEGWRLWAAASGLNVPLTHALSEADRQMAHAGPSVEYRELVRMLDGFENIWFPRMRNVLNRYVEASVREAFVEAFFEDMTQQPEGPLVIGSVKKFVVRYAELRASEVSGVEEALAALEKRGLNDGLLDRIQTALAKAEALDTQRPEPKISREVVAKSAAERREAYETLNLWFIDWGETFRQELPYNILRSLGLVASTRKPTVEPEAPTGPTDPA